MKSIDEWRISPIFTARRTQKPHKLTSEGSSETGAKVLLS